MLNVRQSSLETVARGVFFDTWRNHSQPCPLMGYIPELLQMLNESHDVPVKRLARAIRLRVTEGSLICSIDHEATEVAIEAHVNLAIEALEEVRRRAIEMGVWSSQPVTPLMCG